MTSLRERFPILVLAIAAFTAVFASWSIYRSSKSVATQASVAHSECQSLVERLERLHNAPRIASLEEEPPDRIAARVTSAAAEAQLSPLSILSIDPQAAVRLGRSDYQIRTTQIVLQDATMKQIASFVSGLEDAGSGLIVRDLTLTHSKSFTADDGEVWNVRLALTQMIFMPIGKG